MVFNVAIFISVVLLALLVRGLSSKKTSHYSDASPLPLTSANPAVSPSSTPTSTVAPVLGATTTLAEYNNTKLRFSLMLPKGWQVKEDVLREEGNTEAYCSFSTFQNGTLPGEGKTMADKDLPMVRFFEIENRKIYVISNEEDTPKITVNCLGMTADNESFYMILRSVRFN